MLVRAKFLVNFVNSFRFAIRTPPEVLGMVSSYLTEEDLFSASQVCRYWRSVLISSSSLWTRISCRRESRTIASLERCESMPIQLRLEQPFSSVALEDIIPRKRKIVSLTVKHQLDKAPPLYRPLMSSRPYLERYTHILHPESVGIETSATDNARKLARFAISSRAVHLSILPPNPSTRCPKSRIPGSTVQRLWTGRYGLDSFGYAPPMSSTGNILPQAFWCSTRHCSQPLPSFPPASPQYGGGSKGGLF